MSAKAFIEDTHNKVIPKGQYKELKRELALEDFRWIIQNARMHNAKFHIATDYEHIDASDLGSEEDFELHSEFIEVLGRNNIFEIIGFIFIEKINIISVEVVVKPFGAVTFYKDHIYYKDDAKIDSLMRMCGQSDKIIKGDI